MGTLTAQVLMDRVATVLNDATNVRWVQQDLVRYLNDGQRETVLLKPEACVSNASAVLTASSTKQSIPATGIALVDVVRNMGANGTTVGKVIRNVDRDVLDTLSLDWHTDAADAVNGIQHFTFDPRDPKHYYVYPQAPASAWYVELVCSINPADLPYGVSDNANTTVISLDDIYANALCDYMLYRAYSRDAESGNAGLAAAHYQAFANSLGVKTQNEVQRNPNAASQAK